MKEKLLLGKLLTRYLNNEATVEDFRVFVHLFKQGQLDAILNRLIGCRNQSRYENGIIRFPVHECNSDYK